MDRLIETQFWIAERQDVTVAFVEPRADAARIALARLPGVVAVEPQRSVAVRVRAGHRERYVSPHRRAAGPASSASSIAMAGPMRAAVRCGVVEDAR